MTQGMSHRIMLGFHIAADLTFLVIFIISIKNLALVIFVFGAPTRG